MGPGPGRNRLDETELYGRLKDLDQKLPNVVKARQMGIGRTKFNELIRLWSALGWVAVRPPRPMSSYTFLKQQNEMITNGTAETHVLTPTTRAPRGRHAGAIRKTSVLVKVPKTDGVSTNPPSVPPFGIPPYTPPMSTSAVSLSARFARSETGLNRPGPENQAGNEPETKQPSTPPLQATPVPAKQAPKPSKPKQPPQRPTIRLSDGRKVNSTEIMADAVKFSPQDTGIILRSRRFRLTLLKSMSRCVEKAYIAHWASAHGKPERHWQTRDEYRPQFRNIAEVWAEIYVERGMTLGEFLNAAEEMRPKAVRFPTPDMLVKWMGARIREWVPPEQREIEDGIKTWRDSDGQLWGDYGDGPTKVCGNVNKLEANIQYN